MNINWQIKKIYESYIIRETIVNQVYVVLQIKLTSRAKERL